MSAIQNYIQAEQKYCAHNYKPLPVVIERGEDVWLYDIDGKKYLDMMSAYSAVSFGHSNPRILETLSKQANKLAVCSRAFYGAPLADFVKKLCDLTKLDMALPMNSGAEAVETAIKAVRRWGYKHKNIPENKAEIIVTSNNFHGRTIGIISFSSEDGYRNQFGPFLPGFKLVEFNSIDAVKSAINENTCAIITEPMQGEAGIIVPEKGWLSELSSLCKTENVLLILDEIQTGLGRTGAMFAADHEDVIPDGFILGKALGGGIYPVSAFVARKEVMDVFEPGSHGSTFGGNPLAAAIGNTAIDLLQENDYAQHSKALGNYFMQELKAISHPAILDVRGSGLWIGVEFDSDKLPARDVCIALMKKGVLTKETHETVVRFAPPLTIQKAQIDETLSKLKSILNNN